MSKKEPRIAHEMWANSEYGRRAHYYVNGKAVCKSYTPRVILTAEEDPAKFCLTCARIKKIYIGKGGF